MLDKGASNGLMKQRKNHTSKVGFDTSQKPPSCPFTMKKLGKMVGLPNFLGFLVHSVSPLQNTWKNSQKRQEDLKYRSI